MRRTVRLSLRYTSAAVLFAAATWVEPAHLLAQALRPASNVKFQQIAADDLREWLTYLASDDLQGRQVFTEGYGLAAQYVADRLRSWNVKPLGENGSFLQPVRLKGYKVTRNSSITVEANGQTRTFKHGDHATFAANAGGRQTLTFEAVEFVGYRAEESRARELSGKLIVTVPNLAPPTPGATPGAAAARGAAPPSTLTPGASLRFAPAASAPSVAEQALIQAQTALSQATGALAEAQRAVRGGRAGAPAPAPAGRGNAASAGRGAAAAPATADFSTVQSIDAPVAPQVTGDDALFDVLFAGSGTSFADIKAKAEKGEPLPALSLRAKVTIAIDNTYEVVTQQTTHNVVGVIEGSDPRLKDTYVFFGAHLDHLGYSQTGATRARSTDSCRLRSAAAQQAVVAAGKVVQRPTPPARGGGGPGGERSGGPGGERSGAGGGRTGPPAPAAPPVPVDQRDVVSNGADDDGSGSTALLGIAKAFATGPRPKRSIIVIWHAGEENGLYGSRYNADFPVVPLDRIQSVVNIDMIGRDDCDNIEGDFSNTLFVVGADRISTDLHNLIVETNATLRQPLTLDYELNDAQDPENVYTRSDHFSYAAKGIPVAFFTTGLHPDYHRVTDTVDRIRFDKMTRVTQLAYQTGFAVANSEAALTRDNKGPRTGFGSKAEILTK